MSETTFNKAAAPSISSQSLSRATLDIDSATHSQCEPSDASATSQQPARLGSPALGQPSRISVVFATRGRADTLCQVIELLANQTRKPDSILLSCTSTDDARGVCIDAMTEIVVGPPGLARQRNAALQHLRSTCDIIVFFDDDFVADRRWLEVIEQTFSRHPTISAITGFVVADGVKGPGLSVAAALQHLLLAPKYDAGDIVESYSPYGCNMAFRTSHIDGLLFDERLPLYGWLEDRDFAGALSKRGGRLVQARSAVGVHLGVKAGRVAGHRLGYSQIANPIYMRRKGTMKLTSLLDHVSRNVASNLLFSMWPEPYIDRLGRLKGNLLAARDFLCGTLRPETIETL